MTAAIFGNVGAVGILVFVAVMYFTGQIVPKAMYKDMERQRDFWEKEWRLIRDKEIERNDSERSANTEALRLVQQSFESLSKRRAS